MNDITKEYEIACLTNDRIKRCELLNKHASKINFDDIPIIQFIDACEAGNLQNVKNILNANPNINISACDDAAIREACYNGHLEIAIFLHPHSNVFNKYGNVFQIVCLNGHTNIAKWLYSINPNIINSPDFEFGYKYAIHNQHHKLVDWLKSIDAKNILK